MLVPPLMCLGLQALVLTAPWCPAQARGSPHAHIVIFLEDLADVERVNSEITACRADFQQYRAGSPDREMLKVRLRRLVLIQQHCVPQASSFLFPHAAMLQTMDEYVGECMQHKCSSHTCKKKTGVCERFFPKVTAAPVNPPAARRSSC